MNDNKPHIEAASVAIVVTGLTYALAWLADWDIPQLLIGLPGPIVIFLGIYIALRVVKHSSRGRSQ